MWEEWTLTCHEVNLALACPPPPPPLVLVMLWVQCLVEAGGGTGYVYAYDHCCRLVGVECSVAIPDRGA